MKVLYPVQHYSGILVTITEYDHLTLKIDVVMLEFWAFWI